jgi:hypothetical protein
MTAFGSLKVGMLKRRLKASIPNMQTTFLQLHNIRHFDVFTAVLVQLKKPSGGPKGLLGWGCHPPFRRPEGPNWSPMPWGKEMKNDG